MTASPIPFDEILKDPSSFFNSPQEVYSSEYLTRSAKGKILETWEQDVRALLRAEQESMTAPDKSSKSADLLSRISELRTALDELPTDKPAS